jgi:hypothetical protein
LSTVHNGLEAVKEDKDALPYVPEALRNRIAEEAGVAHEIADRED